MRTKGLHGLLIVLILFISSGCSLGEVGLLNPASESPTLEILRKFPNGTTLDDLDLSDMSLEIAQAKIKEWAGDKLEQKLVLVYNEDESQFSLEELGIRLDFEETWKNLQKSPGQKVRSTLKIDSEKANQVIQEKFSEFTRDPVDGSYRIEQDRFVIQPAVSGRAIQVDPILREIEDRSFVSLPKRIQVMVVDVPAAITTESLEELAFNGVISEFTTHFDVNDKNRTSNLQTAAQKLDKAVLKPGETFSFNDTIGPRSAETGYKDAYVILNNEYVQGIGGGICQVSSTLYSAAVLANLTIEERSPHAVAVAYIPLGQDATVNYPNLDLKIRNDTPSLVYVRTEVKAGSLTVRLYGKKTEQKVRFEQQIDREIDFELVRKLDSSLPPGTVVQDQRGSKGYVVRTWKIVKDASGKQTKELLSRDEYAPAHRILRVGAD